MCNESHAAKRLWHLQNRHMEHNCLTIHLTVCMHSLSNVIQCIEVDYWYFARGYSYCLAIKRMELSILDVKRAKCVNKYGSHLTNYIF